MKYDFTKNTQKVMIDVINEHPIMTCVWVIVFLLVCGFVFIGSVGPV